MNSIRRHGAAGALLTIFLAVSGAAQAFPNLERPDNPALKPLNFGLSTQSKGIVVSPDDRYIVVNDGDEIVLIDTATWERAEVQPPVLDATTDGFDFAPNSSSLFVYQADGKITRILSDDPAADPIIVDVSATIGSGSGPLITDAEIGDNFLYVLNSTSNTLFKYNIATRSIVADGLAVNQGIEGNVAAIAYDALPANVVGNNGGETDKIIATTDLGKVLFIDENLNLLSTIDVTTTNPKCAATASDNLTQVAVGPNRDMGYVLNPTDNVIHVFDLINAVEIDADPTETGINPICLHQLGPGGIDRDINNDLNDLVIVKVNSPLNAIRGYVTGAEGVTVFNGVDPFNFEDIDSGTDEIESISMSAEPNLIAASSQSDGYLYTADTTNAISVISENPFITIASIDPDSVNEGTPSFTLNFQSDEVCEGCHYRIRVNGDIKESGTLLLDTTFTAADAANTAITTPGIDITTFPDGTFIEGSNTIFLFADDASGNTGRDSIKLTVDRPPPDVVILSTSFGNAKGFVEIERLTQEDMKQYNVYVLPALDQANPSCPGGLDFDALVSPTATVAQPDSGSRIRITINGLDNGTSYCVAVEAEDNAGNKSANRVVAPDPILPEVTVGITGASGEAGCALQPGAQSGSLPWLGMGLASLTCLIGFRARRRLRKPIAFGVAMILLGGAFVSSARAVEVSDQHWSAGFQGGFFLPTNPEVDRFLGKCCNGMYQFTFGRLFQDRYEVNLGVAFMIEGANAEGITTERVSGERFNFSVVPISNSFVYRADFHENQLFVPYVGAGFDYMFFRENLEGQVTSGWKFGYHAMAGIEILMEFFDRAADSMEEFGINDTYLTLEGRWNQIDNFGGNGLAFNGFTFSAGLLFNF